MRNVIVLCILVVFTQPVLAKLYKCKDKDGNTAYTDEPCFGGKEMKLPPLHTYTPAVVPSSSPDTKADDSKTNAYESLSITEPEDDKPVYSNTGTVTISYQLKPTLQTDKGHQFTVAVDGKQLKTKGVTSQIKLQNLERGSHSVQIFVVDSKNRIILSSKTTKFHLQKESLINTPLPNSPQNAPKATSAPAAPRAPSL